MVSTALFATFYLNVMLAISIISDTPFIHLIVMNLKVLHNDDVIQMTDFDSRLPMVYCVFFIQQRRKKKKNEIKKVDRMLN